MARLLFEKQGNAIWISHLDLMRLFQRAFSRANLPLTHSQGFNQRPSVSIALPMSVGISSCCELLDFTLERWDVPVESLPEALNKVLIPGVRVLQAYDSGRKVKEIRYLHYCITLHYDDPLPSDATQSLCALFSRHELVLEKRNRNGVTQQNIIPMIREWSLRQTDNTTIQMDALLCCQEPSLNPGQLINAIEKEIPSLLPNWTEIARLEIYDEAKTIFR